MEKSQTSLTEKDDVQNKLCKPCDNEDNNNLKGSNQGHNTSSGKEQSISDLDSQSSRLSSVLIVDTELKNSVIFDPAIDSDSEVDSAASGSCLDDLSTLAELQLEECSLDSCSLNSHSLGDIGREWDECGIKEHSDNEAMVEMALENDQLESKSLSFQEENSLQEIVKENESKDEAINVEKEISIPSDLITNAKDESCDNKEAALPLFGSEDNVQSLFSEEKLLDQTCILEAETSKSNSAGGCSHECLLSSPHTNEECNCSQKSWLNEDSQNRPIDIETDCLRQQASPLSENISEKVDETETENSLVDMSPGKDSQPPIYAQIDRSRMLANRTLAPTLAPDLIPNEDAQLSLGGQSDGATTALGTKVVTFCDNLVQTAESREGSVDSSSGSINEEVANVSSTEIYEDIEKNDIHKAAEENNLVEEHIYDTVEYDTKWDNKIRPTSGNYFLLLQTVNKTERDYKKMHKLLPKSFSL